MTYSFRQFRPLLIAIGLWMVTFLTGCSTADPATSSKAQATPLQPDRLTSDRFKVGDLVTVQFSGSPTLPVEKHEERIKDDGNITLPDIGPILAAGKTRAELQEFIHDKYVPSYYRRLTVIIGSESRCFYVEGQVKAPGRYVFAGEMTVLKCITAAGDFNDFAKKTKVQVMRSNGKIERVNCLDAQRNPQKDIPIYPDDHILVPRRYF